LAHLQLFQLRKAEPKIRRDFPSRKKVLYLNEFSELRSENL
jgi:hypothetical protein